MNRLRLAVNLTTFLVVTLMLGWWAVSNHITFGLTSPAADELVVEFAELPGVRDGSEVTYLGHGIGTVRSVVLDDDGVDIVTAIDPEVELPADLSATVRRRSALGEPYLELAPVEGADPDGPRLAPGGRIARERTTPPVSYEELLTAVSDLLDQVPVDAVDTIVSELDLALDGRGGELRQALADVDAVLTTVAAEAPMLDRLATESTAMAALVADLTPTFAGATDDLAAVVAEVHAGRGALIEAVDRAPALLDRVTDITVAMRPELGCLLGTLDRSLSQLDTPENADRIAAILAGAPSLIAMMQDVTHDRSDGPWLRVDAIFNTGREPVTTYAEPRAIPEPQPTPTCDRQPYAAPDVAGPDERGALAPVAGDRGRGGDDAAAVGGAGEDRVAAPSTDPGNVGPSWWWALVAAIAAGLLVLIVVTLLRRSGGRP